MIFKTAVIIAFLVTCQLIEAAPRKKECLLALNGNIKGACLFAYKRVEECGVAEKSAKTLFDCKAGGRLSHNISLKKCDQQLVDAKFKDHCLSLGGKTLV